MRPAIEVWEDAYRAWDDAPINPDRIGDEDRIAAAIIEADRAELVAEIVRWLNGDHGDWSVAACKFANEIEAKWGKV